MINELDPEEDIVITMLERVSLEKAMRMQYGQRITVVSRWNQRIFECELLRYTGYDRAIERHIFLVRLTDGSMATMTDVELGLRGDAATARFGEPERSADDYEVLAAI